MCVRWSFWFESSEMVQGSVVVCWCCCCCSDLCVDGDPNGNLAWSMRWIWRKLNKAQILVHPLASLAQRTDNSQYCFCCFIDILSCAARFVLFSKVFVRVSCPKCFNGNKLLPYFQLLCKHCWHVQQDTRSLIRCTGFTMKWQHCHSNEFKPIKYALESLRFGFEIRTKREQCH